MDYDTFSLPHSVSISSWHPLHQRTLCPLKIKIRTKACILRVCRLLFLVSPGDFQFMISSSAGIRLRACNCFYLSVGETESRNGVANGQRSLASLLSRSHHHRSVFVRVLSFRSYGEYGGAMMMNGISIVFLLLATRCDACCLRFSSYSGMCCTMMDK